jgi:hypothetical protein
MISSMLPQTIDDQLGVLGQPRNKSSDRRAGSLSGSLIDWIRRLDMVAVAGRLTCRVVTLHEAS